jgi:preprotein translocase subunit SecA
MNKQREIIYTQRAKVLDGEDISDYIKKMISDYISSTVDSYILDSQIRDDWNIKGLRDHLMGFITEDSDLNFTNDQLSEIEKEDIVKQLQEKTLKKYEARENELTTKVLREIERVVLLKVVDTKWMNHIDDMEELKRGIGMRAHYAQKNPVVEYRIEGFDMFDAMIEAIQEDTIRLLFTVQVRVNEPPKREQVLKAEAPKATDSSLPKGGRTVKKKPGRNDPCPCGSGKKYKKCCGMND